MQTITDYYRGFRHGFNYPARFALQYARDYRWADEQESRLDIEIEIITHPEDAPIRGNAIASGDDDYDREVEDSLIADLESGNEWAWCTVEVRVSTLCEHCGNHVHTQSEWLGMCSHDDTEGFKRGGYYTDMLRTALAHLPHCH